MPVSAVESWRELRSGVVARAANFLDVVATLAWGSNKHRVCSACVLISWKIRCRNLLLYIRYPNASNAWLYSGPSEVKKGSIEKLEGKDLKETAACTGESAAGLGESAAGLDQWAPGDMKLLSDHAYETLAILLNMIEDGAEWPERLTNARAAFLYRNPEMFLGPLEYRSYLRCRPRIGCGRKPG